MTASPFVPPAAPGWAEPAAPAPAQPGCLARPRRLARLGRHLGRHLSRLPRGLDRRRCSVATLALGAVAAAALGVWLTASPGTYTVRAVFPSAQGLFSGAAVRLLGVRIGTVTDVEYQDGAVDVTMQLDGSQSLPRNVNAALEAPLLLGTPDIGLSPGYTGGPALQAGAVIPESHTSVPVSTDQLLRQMQRVLGSVDPASAHNLVANLANDIAGQGDEINQLIHGASGTLQLLAAKGSDLGKMNGSLAQLASTLDQHESKLLELIGAYDTVSQVIALHQSDLGSAIDELSKASAQLAALISPNTKPLEQDVAVITTLGRTLDRNLANLDELMASSRRLFAGAHRSYDPVHKWFDLNNQLAPGLTTGLLEGMVRDRLAGICRRVLAHHSAGLSATQKKTLATCGNPDSGFFDPILHLIPRIISGAASPGGGPASSSSLGAALGTGLSKIPGLTPAERRQIGKAAITTTTTAPSHSRPKKHEKHEKCAAGIDGAINCILGPLPSIGGTNSSGSSGLSSSPFAGLLGWSW